MIIIKAGYFLGGKGEGLCTFLNGCNHSPLDYKKKKKMSNIPVLKDMKWDFAFLSPTNAFPPQPKFCCLPVHMPYCPFSTKCPCLVSLALPSAVVLQAKWLPFVLLFRIFSVWKPWWDGWNRVSSDWIQQRWKLCGCTGRIWVWAANSQFMKVRPLYSHKPTVVWE